MMQTTYLKDYQKSHFSIKTTHLHFDIVSESEVYVSSELSITRSHKSDTLVLDGVNLQLISVSINDKQLSEEEFNVTKNKLIILAPTDKEFTLKTKVRINPKTNLRLSGLYYSKGLLITQCESVGFRYITYYLDRPDISSVFTCTIKAPKAIYPTLLANGDLISSKEEGEYLINTWFDPHPKPSYLFALVAGDLSVKEDTFISSTGKSVKIQIYAKKAYITEFDHAVKSLKEAMQFDEEKYGLVYDLDTYMIAAVEDFNYAAMENKGLNVFCVNYLQGNATYCTDNELSSMTSVIAHEYFHNYTGNRVTVRDWFQLCLKEGLTVYRENDFMQTYYPEKLNRLEQAHTMLNHQFVEDKGAFSHSVQPDSFVTIENFYTCTIYDKGSELMRMLSILLGEDKFLQGIKDYLKTFDGTCATIKDILGVLQKYTSYDLNSQFHQWYKQNGTPELTVQVQADEETLNIEFTQKRASHDKSGTKPLLFPVNYAVYSKDGKLIEKSTCIMQKAKQVVAVKNANKDCIVSVLNDFSAPVKLNYDLDAKALEKVLLFEDDAYTKWSTLGQLQLMLLNEEINAKDFANIIIQNLQSMQRSKKYSLAAALLEFISLEKIIVSIDSKIQPADIFNKIEAIKIYIAHNYESTFMQTLNELKPIAHEAENFGARALILAILQYVAINNPAVLADYVNSDNFTLKYGALKLQAAYDKDFNLDNYLSWAKHPTLISKLIFLAGVGVSAETTFDEICNRFDFFKRTCPNHIRSIVRGFMYKNHKFYATDGSGFMFLARIVNEVDRFNPSLSSRLVQAFDNKAQFDDLTRAKIDQAINQIEGNSTNIKEILAKLNQPE